MGLESWIAKIQTKRMDKFCKDTRGLKYQLIAEQKNGSVLKTATKDENVYIVVEEQGINRIVAGFIKKYNDCYFITYRYSLSFFCAYAQANFYVTVNYKYLL